MPVRTVLLVAGAALLGLAIAGLVWARSYAPLRVVAVGPGAGMSRVPRMSGDELALLVGGERHRSGEARFVVRNSGRWPVTIDRPVGLFPCPKFTPADREGTGGCAQVVAVRGVPVHVPAHGAASLWARVSGLCWYSKSDPAAVPGNGVQITFFGVKLHYSYLGVLGRTATVEWPVDLGFRC